MRALLVSLVIAASMLGLAIPAGAWEQEHLAAVASLQVDEEEQTTTTTTDTRRLTIVTVPAVRGMEVEVDGQLYTTDGGGIIRVELTRGTHQISPRPVVQIDEGTRYLFHRWNDRFAGDREIEITRDRELQMGVLVQYDIELRYADGLGREFPTERVESVILINSNGDLTTVSQDDPMEEDELEVGSTGHVWMTSNRLRRTGAGLITKEAVYSARQVSVDGENVVQSGKDVYEPTRNGHWELDLRLYGLLIDIRSFGFGRPVEGDIGLRKAGDDTPFKISPTEDGIATFDNIPVGDFEVTVEDGGWAPVAPIVFSGPKTEILTVITPWVRSFALVVLGLTALSFIAFLRVDRWRVKILLLWTIMAVLMMNVPTIGALGGRPLSLEAVPVYDEDGAFIGIEAVVSNSSAFSVSQVYCTPDFELRILSGQNVWTATYESHDYHDVEFGDCREHRVRPGDATYLLAPTADEEWATSSPDPLPAGEYVAYIKLFAIPADAIRFELTEPIDPSSVAYVVDDPTLGDEIPFTPAEQ